jgi:DNA-binding MurR/RpiR family transcriptional regulator
MARLVKLIGFESYDAFRDVFRQTVSSGGFEHQAQALQSLVEADGEVAVVGEMATTSVTNMERLYSEQEIEVFGRVAQILRESNRIFSVGIGSMHMMAQYFHYIGRMVLPQMQLPASNGFPAVENLLSIKPGDVAILMSVAPYAKQSLEVAKYVNENEAKLIAITDSRGSPVAPLADEVIIAPTDTPHYFPSVVTTASVLESLLAIIASDNNPEMIERLKRFSTFRKSQCI